MKISDALIEWYTKNKRELPWRETRNPYHIWISEIILQQTRVAQGHDYYLHFIDQFPNLEVLAKSTEDEILKAWQGLGYYSRARNLYSTAKHIYFNLHNSFPSSYESLIQLKGVGEYTAAAIASIAYNENVPALDGNVYRFLARLFGIREPIDSMSGKKIFLQKASRLMNSHTPGIFNQAIIEFGALQCIPRQPKCQDCIFKDICIAYKEQMVSELPIKSKRIKSRKRYFYYIVLQIPNGYLIQKRQQKDIWQSLYEFPLIETNRQTSFKNIIKLSAWNNLITKRYRFEKISRVIRHQLSHQTIYCRFIHVTVDEEPLAHPNLILIGRRDFSRFTFPVLISKYINKELS